MKTFRDVIDSWPSLQAFADDMDVPYGTAQVMRYRNSIASWRWQRVAAKAKERGISWITLEVLAAIKAAGAPPPPDPSPRATARSAHA